MNDSTWNRTRCSRLLHHFALCDTLYLYDFDEREDWVEHDRFVDIIRFCNLSDREFFFSEDILMISVLIGGSALMKRKIFLKSMKHSVRAAEPVSPPDPILHQKPNTSLTNIFLLKQKKFCDRIVFSDSIPLKIFMSKLCDKTLSQAAGGYEAYNRRVLKR